MTSLDVRWGKAATLFLKTGHYGVPTGSGEEVGVSDVSVGVR